MRLRSCTGQQQNVFHILIAWFACEGSGSGLGVQIQKLLRRCLGAQLID